MGALTTGANGGPEPTNFDGTAINAINNRMTKDIVLRASNFNDVPTIFTPAGYIMNEDALVSLSGVTLADADSFGDVTTTVNLYSNAGRTTLASNGTEGRLTFGATTGLTSSSGNKTSTITLMGSIVNVQAALNALQFAGAPDYNGTSVGNGSLYLRTLIADFAYAGGQKTATADSTISIVPVNDQPSLTVPGTQTLSSGSSIAITSGFAVDDLKDTSQGASNYLKVTVAATLGVTPYATITFTASGSAIVVGNAGSTVVVKGTALDVQNTLNSMVYTPVSSNANQTIVITTTVDDGLAAWAQAMAPKVRASMEITPAVRLSASTCRALMKRLWSPLPRPSQLTKTAQIIWSQEFRLPILTILGHRRR